VVAQVLEIRGVHGNSAHVEFAPSWDQLFVVTRRGWGTQVSLPKVPTPPPPGSEGGPYAWVHLTIAAFMNERVSGPIVTSGGEEVGSLTVFWATGELVELRAVHFWDGGSLFKKLDAFFRGDFTSRIAPKANTWELGHKLRFGLGVSLQFSFDVPMGGGDQGRNATVTAARATFERAPIHTP
jgi:hypothetical protein